MSGADALIETLLAEGSECVYGIPGAQENEIWDALKTKRLPYLLASHEFSAAAMADGYARSTGKPGVMCIVPGPGLTNALTGLGEALLDSVPFVCHCRRRGQGRKPGRSRCIVSTTRRSCSRSPRKYSRQPLRRFRVRSGRRFSWPSAGEPGPVGRRYPVQPAHRIEPTSTPAPLEPMPPCRGTPESSGRRQLCDRRLRVGIYAGQGCMDHAASSCSSPSYCRPPSRRAWRAKA